MLAALKRHPVAGFLLKTFFYFISYAVDLLIRILLGAGQGTGFIY